MNSPTSDQIRCPRCGKSQPRSPECAYCGIVFAKFIERRRRTVEAVKPESPADLQTATEPSPRPRGPLTRQILTVSERHQLYLHLKSVLISGTPLGHGFAILASTAPTRGLRKLGIKVGLSGGGEEDTDRFLGELITWVPKEEGILIRFGMESGNLEKILLTLEQRCARLREARREAIKRAVYPLLVVISSCFLLPASTLINKGALAYALEAGQGLALIGLVLLAFKVALARLPLVLRPVLARIPASIERRLILRSRTNFMMILELGLKSGQPLPVILDAGARVWISEGNQERTRAASELLAQGGYLSQALAGLLGPEELFMVSAAERSGTLDKAFEELVKVAEQKDSLRKKILAISLAVLLSTIILSLAAGKIMEDMQKVMMPDLDMLMDLQKEVDSTGLDIFNL